MLFYWFMLLLIIIIEDFDKGFYYLIIGWVMYIIVVDEKLKVVEVKIRFTGREKEREKWLY